MRNSTKKALRESFTDTLVALAINVPLNFVLISSAFALKFNAVETTIYLTAVFTVTAIIRKTYIRLLFEKKYGKKDGQDRQEQPN